MASTASATLAKPPARSRSPTPGDHGGNTTPRPSFTLHRIDTTTAASSSSWSAPDRRFSSSHSRHGSRAGSLDFQEKPRLLPIDIGAAHHHSHHSHSHTHTPSPLASFPPAWSHPAESQLPPRSRPPLRRMVLTALRERLCGSKGGALGRGLIIGWVVTTLGFLAATAFWKGELFSALDDLSKNLYEMGYQGLLVFGVLIFITTIPPLPLYSTLIVLSGYTFGVWYGFVASYIASLVGAVVVFVVSRTLLRDTVTKCLASSPTATSLLQIIPQNPHLLLLIRVAPYPYNLLNVVLASAPTLSLQTYTACTALSLCKLVLHTWIGAGIHDLSAAYNASPDGGGSTQKEPTEDDLHRDRVKTGATWGGIALCILLFVYLTHIAKREIAKAQDEQRVVREEEVAFLTPLGEARDCDEDSAC